MSSPAPLLSDAASRGLAGNAHKMPASGARQEGADDAASFPSPPLFLPLTRCAPSRTSNCPCSRRPPEEFIPDEADAEAPISMLPAGYYPPQIGEAVGNLRHDLLSAGGPLCGGGVGRRGGLDGVLPDHPHSSWRPP